MHINQEIHKFAVKWYKLFADRKTKGIKLLDISFGKSCLKFGFESDGGESFTAVYPGAFANPPEGLKKIIFEVNDINLLGNAILSMWRSYRFSYWPSQDIASEEDREWFMTALNRLKELTDYPPSFFEWYKENNDKLEKIVSGDMKRFLEEHPEKKTAYWFKLFDSGMTTEELNRMILNKKE